MSPRVLVVDDEPGIRQALKQVLEYEGMDVRPAASGGFGWASALVAEPVVVAAGESPVVG